MKGRVYLTVGMAAALIVGSVLAEEGAKPGRRRPRGPGRGGPKGRAHMHRRMIAEFDKDGDGELSEQEREAASEARQARRAEMVKKFDKDGDGELNEEEREAAHEARRAEIEERCAEFLKKSDKDGDGEIGAEERKAARKGRRKKHGPKDAKEEV